MTENRELVDARDEAVEWDENDGKLYYGAWCIVLTQKPSIKGMFLIKAYHQTTGECDYFDSISNAMDWVEGQ